MDRIDLGSIVHAKKGVIFDLFHTLTAIEEEWGPGTGEMLGVPQDAWDEQLHPKSRDRLTGRLRDPLAILTGMAHAIDAAIPRDTIEAALANRLRRFEWALVNIPAETLSVLRELKRRGKKLGLISDADVMEVAAWDRCPLRPLMDAAIFSFEAGCCKPEARIYELCLERPGLTPADCVYFGDGGSDELAGARRVGMTSVMVTGVIEQLSPEKVAERRPDADFVIQRLTELLPCSD
jgi:putative hydrolase of the HAD superfamily